jgi:hypothetical protein
MWANRQYNANTNGQHRAANSTATEDDEVICRYYDSLECVHVQDAFFDALANNNVDKARSLFAAMNRVQFDTFVTIQRLQKLYKICAQEQENKKNPALQKLFNKTEVSCNDRNFLYYYFIYYIIFI